MSRLVPVALSWSVWSVWSVFVLLRRLVDCGRYDWESSAVCVDDRWVDVLVDGLVQVCMF